MKERASARISDTVMARIRAILALLSVYGLMTVRQLYYQLVPQGLRYSQVQYAAKIGRIHGLIHPNSIVDRSRPSYGLDVWVDADEVLDYYSERFKLDYWVDAPYRLEIWTEKDAISAILNQVAEKYRVPVRVTRGSLSISKKSAWGKKGLRILYVGDHDPSGLFMDKDLQDNPFLEFSSFKRVALTLDQINQYQLPSVPVKRSDPRAKDYVAEHGGLAWEVDALEPTVLKQLLEESILQSLPFDLDSKRDEEAELRRTFAELRRGLLD